MSHIDVRWESGSPDAIWAGRAVRELAAARLEAFGSQELQAPEMVPFVEALSRVLEEAFEGAPMEQPHVQRVGYLLMAFSKLAIVAAASTASLVKITDEAVVVREPGEKPTREDVAEIQEVLHVTLAQHEGGGEL